MKNNSKIIIVAVLAMAAGLIAGYFIFNKSQSANTAHQHLVTAPAAQDATTYTCSMHPQIRQDEPGECAICGMDLIPVDEAGSNGDPAVFSMTEDALKLANVQTSIAGGESTAGKTITLNGKIQADERLAASQVAHVPGRIDRLYITFTGEQIRKGQKLADIYSPELVTAQRELLEALKFQEVNPALVKAARQKLVFWKIPQRTINDIETSGKVQENFTLFADAGGVVTERHVSVGDYAKQGDVLFDLVNMQKLWVLFDAYEDDLPNIRKGDKIIFTTPSSPDKQFETRVTFIDPILNPKNEGGSH